MQHVKCNITVIRNNFFFQVIRHLNETLHEFSFFGLCCIFQCHGCLTFFGKYIQYPKYLRLFSPKIHFLKFKVIPKLASRPKTLCNTLLHRNKFTRKLIYYQHYLLYQDYRKVLLYLISLEGY